jgi:ribosomal protein S3AE
MLGLKASLHCVFVLGVAHKVLVVVFTTRRVLSIRTTKLRKMLEEGVAHDPHSSRALA